MRSRKPSPQTLVLLASLVAEPAAWRHGYELGKALRLSSGTLYPLLIRLHERGLLEARWTPPEAPGRLARHAYRLSADGIAYARALRTPAVEAPHRSREALA